jgi:hypothetical protein
VDSSSTHNFIITQVANKLQCNLTTIKPLTVANGGDNVCRNFRWKMQGVSFLDNAFVVELKNYGMVLGIQ